MGWTGKTSPHPWSPPTSQLPGLKLSASDGLVPDTTAYLQRSSGVQALMGQDCFEGKRGAYSTLGGGGGVMLWWVVFIVLPDESFFHNSNLFICFLVILFVSPSFFPFYLRSFSFIDDIFEETSHRHSAVFHRMEQYNTS